MDSARGVAATIVFCHNGSCDSSCDTIVRSGRKLLHSFRCFDCNCSFAIVCVKGRSKHVAGVVAAESIAVAPLADFIPSPNIQVRAEELTEFGFRNRTLRNCI